MTKYNSALESRKILIDTIGDTLDANEELGNVSTIASTAAGQIAVLRGSAAAGTVHEHSPVSLTLIEHQAANGAKMASILLRGGYIGRSEFSLEPGAYDNTQLDEYTAASDAHIANMVSAVSYDQASSDVAAEQVKQYPYFFGLHPQEVE